MFKWAFAFGVCVCFFFCRLFLIFTDNTECFDPISFLIGIINGPEQRVAQNEYTQSRTQVYIFRFWLLFEFLKSCFNCENSLQRTQIVQILPESFIGMFFFEHFVCFFKITALIKMCSTQSPLHGQMAYWQVFRGEECEQKKITWNAGNKKGNKTKTEKYFNFNNSLHILAAVSSLLSRPSAISFLLTSPLHFRDPLRKSFSLPRVAIKPKSEAYPHTHTLE